MRSAKVRFDGQIQFQASQFCSKRSFVAINFSQQEGANSFLRKIANPLKRKGCTNLPRPHTLYYCFGVDLQTNSYD